MPIILDDMHLKCSKNQHIIKFYSVSLVDSNSQICRVEGAKEVFDPKDIYCNQFIDKSVWKGWEKKCFGKKMCRLKDTDVLIKPNTPCSNHKMHHMISLSVQYLCGVDEKTLLSRNIAGIQCSCLGALGSLIFFITIIA